MSDEEERGFRVRDRRRFTESGDPREDEPGEPQDETNVGEEERREQPREEPPQEAPRDGSSADDPPYTITFSTFLISLSTQALACLGDLSESEDAEPLVDIQAAREMIDILGMLRDKTRGNLDPSEANLLEGILYDLRMRYVKKVRS